MQQTKLKLFFYEKKLNLIFFLNNIKMCLPQNPILHNAAILFYYVVIVVIIITEISVLKSIMLLAMQKLPKPSQAKKKRKRKSLIFHRMSGKSHC